MTCRICQDEEQGRVLLRPCACRGSMEFVHGECLARWRKTQSRARQRRCEVCHAPYVLAVPPPPTRWQHVDDICDVIYRAGMSALIVLVLVGVLCVLVYERYRMIHMNMDVESADYRSWNNWRWDAKSLFDLKVGNRYRLHWRLKFGGQLYNDKYFVSDDMLVVASDRACRLVRNDAKDVPWWIVDGHLRRVDPGRHYILCHHEHVLWTMQSTAGDDAPITPDNWTTAMPSGWLGETHFVERDRYESLKTKYPWWFNLWRDWHDSNNY